MDHKNLDQFIIRAITPEDKDGLQEGLAMMSPESKRQRFFSSRKGFTDKELKFFTEVDQHDHLAYVAINRDENGPSPAGSIRCVRDIERAAFAELAVTIVDVYQRRGLGTAMLENIASASQKENITHFYGDFHTSNTGILKLLEKYGVRHNVSLTLKHKSDGFLYFEMPLA
jgi:RimJ/RimL family protein N-acetyltransferase